MYIYVLIKRVRQWRRATQLPQYGKRGKLNSAHQFFYRHLISRFRLLNLKPPFHPLRIPGIPGRTDSSVFPRRDRFTPTPT